MYNIKKTIIPIAVIILLVNLTFSPIIIADPLDIKTKKMTVLAEGIKNENFKLEVEISDEDLNKLNNKINNLMETINFTINENSEQGTNISDNEWDLIKNIIYKIFDLIAEIFGKDFPLEETKIFIDFLIEKLINPVNLFKQPIISLGVGFTFIPFYDYETFFGKLIRPVIMQHFLGFSATTKFNIFVVGFPYLKFGLHRIRTFFFNGLMINFTDLGVNRLIGPQILLGFGCFTGFA